MEWIDPAHIKGMWPVLVNKAVFSDFIKSSKYCY
jgi:hypothetical protein